MAVLGSVSDTSGRRALRSLRAPSVSIVEEKLISHMTCSHTKGSYKSGFDRGAGVQAVSYTHLTLPTNREV